MLVLFPSCPMSPFCWPKDKCLSRLCSLRIGSMLAYTILLIGMNPLFGSPLDHWLQSCHPIGILWRHPWYLPGQCNNYLFWQTQHHTLTLKHQQTTRKIIKKEKKTCLEVNNIKWTRDTPSPFQTLSLNFGFNLGRSLGLQAILFTCLFFDKDI